MIRIHEMIQAMYVCVCNAVTERTIRELVADGYHSLNEIQALTGCSGTCGRCADHAEAVIEASLARPKRAVLPVIDPVGDLPTLRSA
jgi:bacterioferritin-associated ferredoxin